LESEESESSSQPPASEHDAEDLENDHGAPRRRVPKNSRLARLSDDEDSSSSDGPTFVVFVKVYTGKTITLLVNASDTIDNVKTMLQDEEDYESRDFQLIFAGKFLDDERTLASCGIAKESTLWMFGGIAGGAGVKKQNVKLKKPIKKIYAPQAVDATVFVGVEEAVRRISASQNFGAEQVLKSMSDEGLAEFRADIESGKAALEKRVQTASKHTKEGIMLTKVTEVLEETSNRLESLDASALTEKFENVHALLSAVDVEIGRRQARNI
jgi:hypothetical protein